MAEIIRVLLLNFKFTNGAAGLSAIPRNVNWSWLFVLTVGTVISISNFQGYHPMDIDAASRIARATHGKPVCHRQGRQTRHHLAHSRGTDPRRAAKHSHRVPLPGQMSRALMQVPHRINRLVGQAMHDYAMLADG